MKCPKCGKPMSEEPKFKGLWTCPDYKVVIGDREPFKFKCTGLHLTQKGGDDFVAELQKVHARRTAQRN